MWCHITLHVNLTSFVIPSKINLGIIDLQCCRECRQRMILIWLSIVVDELCVVVSTQNWCTLLTGTLEEALRFLLSFPSYNFEFLSVLVLAVAMDFRDG